MRLAALAALTFLTGNAFAAITAINPADITNPTISLFGSPNVTIIPPNIFTSNGASFTSTQTFYSYPVAGSGILDIDGTVLAAGTLSVSLSAATTMFGLEADETLNGGFTLGRGFTITQVDFFTDAGFTTSAGTYSVSTDIENSVNEFFGLQNTTPFQSVIFTLSSCNCGQGTGFSSYLDDFKVQGAAVATPEPATMSLLAFGLLPAAWWLIRRKRLSQR
jgi:hypothetical protein